MPIITTTAELYFISLLWGLGHMILGYRFRGFALLSLGIGSISTVILLGLVQFLNLNYYNYIQIFIVVVLIIYVIVYFDLWKILRKINTQSYKIDNNQNIPSKAPISSSKAPISSSKAPISTSKAPISTSKAPISTSNAPISNSIEMLLCKRCHNVNSSGSRFCSCCGISLNTEGSMK